MSTFPPSKFQLSIQTRIVLPVVSSKYAIISVSFQHKIRPFSHVFAYMLIPVEQLIDILPLAQFDGLGAVLNAKPVNDRAEVVHRISYRVSGRMDNGAGLSDGMAQGDVPFAVNFFRKGVTVQDLSLG